MFLGLWLFVLATLAGASLWLWRRPVPLRLPRGFWLVNLALAALVGVFILAGLQSVFGPVHPFLEVARIRVPWPEDGSLTLGRDLSAGLPLHNPLADRLHASLSRAADDTALLLP